MKKANLIVVAVVLVLILSAVNYVFADDGGDSGGGSDGGGGDAGGGSGAGGDAGGDASDAGPGGPGGSTAAGPGEDSTIGDGTGDSGGAGGDSNPFARQCGDGWCNVYYTWFCDGPVDPENNQCLGSSAYEPIETCARCAADCGVCCVPNTGQSCGSCGGIVNCDGSCSVSTPSNLGQSCGSCGGTIQCSGQCSVSTPSNYNQPCGYCGRVDCSGNCPSAGSCTPGAAQCSGNSVQQCQGSCSWSTTQNCDSSDGWVCNGAVREFRDYGCANGACSYSVTSSENCGTKDSVDTDGSGTAYTIAGSVTDYVGCTPSACTSNSLSDSCSGTILTEYGANMASYTSSQYECQNYENNYCSNDRYYRREWGCSGNPGYCNDAAIADTATGTNADNDVKDFQCGDSLCDNAAGVYDSTKTAAETSCADGLDNDCNGLTDCADPACDGSISGTVSDNNNQPVGEADVTLKKDLSTVKSTTTSQQGSYNLAGVNCGSYSLSVLHPNYAPKTDSISLAPSQQATKDYTLVLGTSCEADCTYANDDIVHASCDGKNGCAFYDSTAKAACDNSQPGWARDYDASNYVTCASGSPQPTVTIQASVSCSSGTLVKVTRIVVYNGEPVKLVVATCG